MIALVFQLIGWVAAIAFLLGLAFAFFECPPWSEAGQAWAVWMIPFLSGIFLIPVAALFISWGRLLASQQKDLIE